MGLVGLSGKCEIKKTLYFILGFCPQNIPLLVPVFEILKIICSSWKKHVSIC